VATSNHANYISDNFVPIKREISNPYVSFNMFLPIDSAVSSMFAVSDNPIFWPVFVLCHSLTSLRIQINRTFFHNITSWTQRWTSLNSTRHKALHCMIFHIHRYAKFQHHEPPSCTLNHSWIQENLDIKQAADKKFVLASRIRPA
jgi:hypothetical protein